MEAKISDFARLIIAKAVELARYNEGQRISAREIQTAVRSIMPRALAISAVASATDLFNEIKIGAVTDKYPEVKALFPRGSTVHKGAIIYLAGVLKFAATLPIETALVE